MIREELKRLVDTMRKDVSKGLCEKAHDLVYVLLNTYDVSDEEGQEVLEYAFNGTQLAMINEWADHNGV